MSTGPFLDLTTSTADGGVQLASLVSAGSVPFFSEDEQWNTVTVDGEELPGLCSVSGKGIEYHLDQKKSPGTNGSAIANMGRKSAEIEVTLRMWMPEHLETFQRILNNLRNRKIPEFKRPPLEAGGTGGVSLGGPDRDISFEQLSNNVYARQLAAHNAKYEKKLAVQIYHPVLALYKIRQVMLKVAGFPEKRGEEWQVRLTFVEFHKSKAAVITPKGTSLASALTASTSGSPAKDEAAKPSQTSAGP